MKQNRTIRFSDIEDAHVAEHLARLRAENPDITWADAARSLIRLGARAAGADGARRPNSDDKAGA